VEWAGNELYTGLLRFVCLEYVGLWAGSRILIAFDNLLAKANNTRFSLFVL
jgi:hypothetical protein